MAILISSYKTMILEWLLKSRRRRDASVAAKALLLDKNSQGCDMSSTAVTRHSIVRGHSALGVGTICTDMHKSPLCKYCSLGVNQLVSACCRSLSENGDVPEPSI